MTWRPSVVLRVASHRQTVDAGEWILEWAELRCVQLRARDHHSSADIVERHVRLHLAPNLAGIKLGELLSSTEASEVLNGLTPPDGIAGWTRGNPLDGISPHVVVLAL